MEGFRHMRVAFQGEARGLDWLGTRRPGTGGQGVGQACGVANSAELRAGILRGQPRGGSEGESWGLGHVGRLVAQSF